MSGIPAYAVATRSEPGLRGALKTVGRAFDRELPPRYGSEGWDRPFRARLDGLLHPGISVLDVGSGARPTLAPAERPKGTTYVGLDPSAAELDRAEPGSYDEAVVAPAEQRAPSLEGRFDLALSWLAMEHIDSLDLALANIRSCLVPGGTLVAQLAGGWSPFAIANRVLPGKVSRWILARAQGREPESVFPANYDRCRYSLLVESLRGWSESEVVPLYAGAGYVLFSRALTGVYIAYEEFLQRRGVREAAPYYLLVATS